MVPERNRYLKKNIQVWYSRTPKKDPPPRKKIVLELLRPLYYLPGPEPSNPKDGSKILVLTAPNPNNTSYPK